jgi:putative DNA primase/helicase
MIRAQDIHARIAWPAVLEQLGGVSGFGSKKPRPCPICGGKDRFVPDNRRGRGDYFCRGCGPGDGFALLMKLHGWSFAETRRRVIEAAGLSRDVSPPVSPIRPPEPVAKPSARVLRLVRESCPIADCDDARGYLEHRGLWPLPDGCSLRAHPSVEYFADGVRVGRFPALVATVRDIDGALASAQVTYLQRGRKLETHQPRKLLSPLTGRRGCAVRLTAATEILGIAEGIETALAAHRQTGITTWAALCAAVLARFEPSPIVKRLVIFADRDAPGLEAAARLAESLQGRIAFEIRPPLPPAKDWAEGLQLSNDNTQQECSR